MGAGAAGAGLTGALSACSAHVNGPEPVMASAPVRAALEVRPIEISVRPTLDPAGLIRPELLSRAREALDFHAGRIANRERIYLVDFARHSAEPRLFELNMISGEVAAFRTAHGRGSDPEHSGFARRFSNVQDSHQSSVGAYLIAGPGHGMLHGPNVLLDGLDYTNSLARQRAIIIHGADYAEPDFLAREGKLGRSFGCFSTAHADLHLLRQRMGEGRMLFAFG